MRKKGKCNPCRDNRQTLKRRETELARNGRVYSSGLEA